MKQEIPKNISETNSQTLNEFQFWKFIFENIMKEKIAENLAMNAIFVSMILFYSLSFVTIDRVFDYVVEDHYLSRLYDMFIRLVFLTQSGIVGLRLLTYELDWLARILHDATKKLEEDIEKDLKDKDLKDIAIE